MTRTTIWTPSRNIKAKVPPKKYLHGLGWIAANVDCSWLDAETVVPSIELCLLADLFNVELDEAVKHLRSVVEAVAALTTTNEIAREVDDAREGT